MAWVCHVDVAGATRKAVSSAAPVQGQGERTGVPVPSPQRVSVCVPPGQAQRLNGCRADTGGTVWTSRRIAPIEAN